MKTRAVLFAAALALGFLAFDGTATDTGLVTEDAAACEFDQCEPCPSTLPPVKEGVKDPDAFKDWLTCPT